MRRLLRWYGANPLHLLALLGCFALAGYAAARLVPSRPLGVAVWFLGAVVGHDLLLVPLYTLADRSAAAAIRHSAPRLPAIPWINYLRVPAALSLLLLLVWFPLILRLHTNYHASTTLSPSPYLWHWLAVTGALFLMSAAAFALRLRATQRPTTPPGRQPATPSAVGRGSDNRHTPVGSPGPGSPGSTRQSLRTAGQEAGEPEPPRPLPPPPGEDHGDDDHAASPGQHHPAAQAHDVTPADQTDRAPGTDPRRRHPGHRS
jgi:hypothetical protein